VKLFANLCVDFIELTAMPDNGIFAALLESEVNRLQF
jgi:hypothetical protein